MTSLFAFAALTLLTIATLTSTAHATCENVPLSFTTTNEIGFSSNRIRAGDVTVTLMNGVLTAIFELDSGCTLTDAIHINLLPTTTDVGDSVRPIPGRFPCQEPASGSSQTVTCDIEDFDLGDCCAGSFRLFTHLVVNCGEGAEEETAFAGPTMCTTTRWCDFEDVDVTIDCDVCNECSTAASACVPAATDPMCTGMTCIDSLTVGENMCSAGACVEQPLTDCLTCTMCEESGSTASCQNVDTDSRCTGSSCESSITVVTNTCVSGSCDPVPTDCDTCTICDDSSGTAVCMDTSTDSRCSGSSCSGSTIEENVCMGGSCVMVPDTTCSMCNECVESGGTASCVFDSGSPTQEVCSDCGFQCTDGQSSAATGPGACVDQCMAGESCQMGATDNLDMCIPSGCMSDGDCESGEVCVILSGETTGTCETLGSCSANQEELCDQVFEVLRTDGGNNAPGICCPAGSGCVDMELGLGTQSICATTCGVSCSPSQEAAAASGVMEVYCIFGDETNPSVADVPRCSEIAV